MYILPVLCRTFEKVHALHSQETKLSEKMNLLMTEWVTTGEIASRNATMAVCRVGWVAGVAGCQKSICTQQKVDIWFSDNCLIFVIFSTLIFKLVARRGRREVGQCARSYKPGPKYLLYHPTHCTVHCPPLTLHRQTLAVWQIFYTSRFYKLYDFTQKRV